MSPKKQILTDHVRVNFYNYVIHPQRRVSDALAFKEQVVASSESGYRKQRIARKILIWHPFPSLLLDLKFKGRHSWACHDNKI